MEAHVLIVGGGLSGLHTAYELSKRDINFVLLEARPRLGGRILSYNPGQSEYVVSHPGLDLGPSWFWPGQNRIVELLSELKLNESVLPQYASGEAMFEDNRGVQRGVAGISMAGSFRLRAGIGQLTAALAATLEPLRVYRDARVTRAAYVSGKIRTDVLIDGKQTEIRSDAIVFAMPPRLVIEGIELEPPVTRERHQELSAIPTWMAGQAKFVATYAEPFWRKQGLSGDVISHRGPLAEIHDASANHGAPYALFGFMGVRAEQREGNSRALQQAAVEQLVRLFGDAAASPLDIMLKDWAFDDCTASQWDRDLPNSHPISRLADTSEADWNRRLLWSGSETANGSERNNGYLEGALEASERTVASIVAGKAKELSGQP